MAGRKPKRVFFVETGPFVSTPEIKWGYGTTKGGVMSHLPHAKARVVRARLGGHPHAKLFVATVEWSEVAVEDGERYHGG